MAVACTRDTRCHRRVGEHSEPSAYPRRVHDRRKTHDNAGTATHSGGPAEPSKRHHPEKSVANRPRQGRVAERKREGAERRGVLPFLPYCVGMTRARALGRSVSGTKNRFFATQGVAAARVGT